MHYTIILIDFGVIFMLPVNIHTQFFSKTILYLTANGSKCIISISCQC